MQDKQSADSAALPELDATSHLFTFALILVFNRHCGLFRAQHLCACAVKFIAQDFSFEALIIFAFHCLRPWLSARTPPAWKKSP